MRNEKNPNQTTYQIQIAGNYSQHTEQSSVMEIVAIFR